MTGPLSLAAGPILELALKKFLETAAGETAKQFTTTALKKMDELRRKIWARLRGQAEVEQVVTEIEQGGVVKPAHLEILEPYLQIAMRQNPAFAQEIQQLAQEINQEINQSQTSLVQNNYGGTNYQTQTGPNNTNFLGGSHTHQSKS
jgi:hypothetical protein